MQAGCFVLRQEEKDIINHRRLLVFPLLWWGRSEGNYTFCPVCATKFTEFPYLHFSLKTDFNLTRMNQKALIITLSIALLVLVGLCSQQMLKKPLVALPEGVYPAPELPSEMSFAGERVPLEIPDVNERMDRELTLNAYFHSNTFLGIKRMNRHLPQIEKQLRESGIPDDFKYLALAESLFGNVTSPAGASGFWQIMPETGKGYGLRITDEVDERFHAEKATAAAAKYLHQAKVKFGNWTLAAASYNRGMNGLQNALDKQRVTSYYDLFLNDETSRYLFRILALKEVLGNHAKYGFLIPEEQRYQLPQTRKVEVTTTIPDLVQFALDQKTNYKTLRLLNPWIRSYSLTVEPGQAGYVLELPR